MSRKCNEGDCSEEGSVRTDGGALSDIVPGEDTPWYLRGPKTLYVNYYAISEADFSTESELEEGEQEDSSDDDINEPGDSIQVEFSKETTPGGGTQDRRHSESAVTEPSTQDQSSPEESKTDRKEKESSPDHGAKDPGKEESETHRAESSTQGDYWQIRKLMKYIRGGDEAATTVALCIVAQHDLTLEGHKNAIIDTGGLELFLNLLNVKSLKCVQGALGVLKQLVIMPDVGADLIELGIMEDLIGLLKTSEEDILADAVCILADLAESQLKMRTISRKIGILPYLIFFGPKVLEWEEWRIKYPSVPKSPSPSALCFVTNYLVDVLDKIPRHVILESVNNLTGSPMVSMDIALDSMRALASLSRSPGVRMALYHCGIMHMIPALLRCQEEDLKTNALVIIMQCASLPMYRKSFEAHNILKLVISCWKDQSKDEVILRIIYKMAISEEGRNQAIKCRVLKKIIPLMKDEKTSARFNVLKYCLASIYRLGFDRKVRDTLQDMDLIGFLVKNLTHDDESLAVYVSGVLSYLSPYPNNLKRIRDSGCVKILFNIINGKMDPALLANVDQVIGDLCKDPDILAEFCSKDAMRHIWSHLSYDSVDLQIAASKALIRLVNVDDAGEDVRNLSGSMDCLMKLLDSTNNSVKASSGETLAHVSKDPENLTILMQMGIVNKINQLITIENADLTRSLCLLIAAVAENPEGCFKIGRSETVVHLVNYLLNNFDSASLEIKAAAARALWKLSQEPVNAANLYQAGVVPLLIDCLRERDPQLREPVEGCLFIMRSLAQGAEEISYFGSLRSGQLDLGGKPQLTEYEPKFFKEPTAHD